LKRVDLVAGKEYAKAGNNYGDAWANVDKVTVLDTGSWWEDRNHVWRHTHYGKKVEFTTETGVTFEKASCCFGQGSGNSYSTRGVLVRDHYHDVRVMPLNLIRDTWENYEAMEAERKAAAAAARAARMTREATNIATRKHLDGLVETYNIPGTLSGGEDDERYASKRDKEPLLTLNAEQVEKLAEKLHYLEQYEAHLEPEDQWEPEPFDKEVIWTTH
jgi:hypothetical protein